MLVFHVVQDFTVRSFGFKAPVSCVLLSVGRLQLCILFSLLVRCRLRASSDLVYHKEIKGGVA